MKKKLALSAYIFISFIFNFIIIEISCPFITILLCNLVNGRLFPHQISNIKNRIDGAFGILIFLSIYISINILTYKIIAKRLVLKKIYIIMPIVIMIIAFVLGVLVLMFLLNII